MISFDGAGDFLDEVADSLPQEFFRNLNGGIRLVPETKHHPVDPDGLLIMGEYQVDPVFGRSIVIYYGSVSSGYAHLSESGVKAELRRILLHEFTHHLESLAGERGLEIKDKVFLEQFLDKKSHHS
jgi:hypothetical protein